MKNSRRNFLKKSALATAGTMLIPSFLSAFQRGNQFPLNSGKRLVVIQLSGGNDGLNTVVPYSNDIYHRLRPSLAVGAKDVWKLDDELGLNPVMKGLKEIYDEGFLSVVNSVGYPNPDRSHFRSMDIWHSGSASHEYWQTGWLGRYLDAKCEGEEEVKSYYGIEADDALSLAMKGNRVKGMAVKDIRKLHQTTKDEGLRHLAGHYPEFIDDHDHQVAYLYKTMAETFSSADYIYEKSKIYQSTQEYPQNKFAKQLKNVAELIISQADVRVFYLSLSGFDTHAFQKNPQERLLKTYSESVHAFVKDLKKNNGLDDTLIMTFSEFGRRVAQNASNGTDHGTANNLFLIGGKLKKAGIYNGQADLSDLDNGDLKFKVDFRNIYAEVLDGWLNTQSEVILKEKFKRLGIV